MFDVKALLTLILLVIPSWATAQYSRKYVELTTKADSLFMLGEYKAASHAFGEALQMTEFVQPQHRYNGACAAAMANDPETAFSRLYTKLYQEKDWYSDNIANDECNVRLKDLANLCAVWSNKNVLFDLPSETERRGYSVAFTAILKSDKLKSLGFVGKIGIKEAIKRTLSILE